MLYSLMAGKEERKRGGRERPSVQVSEKSIQILDCLKLMGSY